MGGGGVGRRWRDKISSDPVHARSFKDHSTWFLEPFTLLSGPLFIIVELNDS